ncbi:MAG: hypothetical protein AB1486_12890 [Planctomycetota bacterium]
MPELEDLEEAGQRDNGARHAGGVPGGTHEDDSPDPEHDVDRASEVVLDPRRPRPLIGLAAEAEQHEAGQVEDVRDHETVLLYSIAARRERSPRDGAWRWGEYSVAERRRSSKVGGGRPAGLGRKPDGGLGPQAAFSGLP